MSREAIRIFKAEANELWGTFKFSFDSNYIAKCGDSILSVFELPSMKLILGPD